MKILDLLTYLANNVLDEDDIGQIIKTQPNAIRHAIESNNSEKLKACISDKGFYAHEVKVTVY